MRGSPGSGASPKRRSTWSTKPVRRTLVTMRARQPDTIATLTRQGVDVGYEVWEPSEESNGRTIVFAPMDTIIDSRGWTAQFTFLSRHARVVAIDGRGNGRSGRPLEPEAYSDLALAADLVAVLDEAEVD